MTTPTPAPTPSPTPAPTPSPTPSPSPSPAPSPTPSPTPEPTAWYSDDQKDYVANKAWKTPADAVTSAINLEKLIGADRAGRTIVLPKDDKDVDGMKAFRSKLGVPDSADGYELPVPEGQEADFAKLVSGWFHENGIPKAAGQKITGAWNAHITKLLADGEAADKAASTQAVTALKGEWGNDFDKNSEFARRAGVALGWDTAKQARYEAAFGTADLLKTLHSIGSKMGEHSFTGSDGGNTNMTPAKARERIETIKQQRTAGTMNAVDFHKEMDQLGPIATQGT